MYILNKSEITMFCIVSDAEEIGLSLPLSETQKTGFVVSRPNYFHMHIF